MPLGELFDALAILAGNDGIFEVSWLVKLDTVASIKALSWSP
jgi:hypothetical protein